jgi:tetratricopeptide (TPR) repeat protein
MHPSLQIEQRLRTCRPTALIGELTGVPPIESPVDWIVVDSERTRSLATLLNAEREVARMRGASPELGWSAPPAELDGRDRRNHRGDQAESLRELLETARGGARGPSAVVFRNLEAADDESLELLRHVVLHAARLPLPIVLHFAREALPGTARELLDAIELVEGERAVIWLPSRSVPSAPVEQRTVQLSAEVRRVLRAAAALGGVFRAEVVARLTRTSLMDVLECLQAARDAGIGVGDAGDGQFYLEPDAVTMLRGELLPTLAEAYGEDEGSGRHEPVLEPIQAREPHRAAEGHVLAARQLAVRGEYERAAKAVTQALEIVEQMPEGDARRLLSIRANIESARIRAQSAFQRGFGLGAALSALSACQKQLGANDPLELRAGLSLSIAEVCSEIGSPEALQRALAELEGGRRVLKEARRTRELVQFMNCEAALWLKVGQTEQAEALAGQVQELIEALGASDSEVLAELAESHHVLARRAVHVGRDALDAQGLDVALKAAREAERIYASLGSPQQLARVWLTLGRLEQIGGRSAQALEHLRAADTTQRALGDVLGAARTAAAFADLALDAGDYHAALSSLADSVAFNVDRGTPLGLAYNRATLDRLVTRLPPQARADHGAAVLDLLARIAQRSGGGSTRTRKSDVHA